MRGGESKRGPGPAPASTLRGGPRFPGLAEFAVEVALVLGRALDQAPVDLEAPVHGLHRREDVGEVPLAIVDRKRRPPRFLQALVALDRTLAGRQRSREIAGLLLDARRQPIEVAVPA